MLNHIDIMGRLSKDPELRYTQNQTPVASFSVAVERDFTDQSGTRPVDFIDCVAWRSAAEFVSKYFRKGDMIVVAGRLAFRSWKDRSGNDRRSAEINVEHAYFGGSAKQTAPGSFSAADDSGPLPWEE